MNSPQAAPATLSPGASRAGQRGEKKRRGGEACIICNKRKIRCTLSQGIKPCENCVAFGYQCVPRERKRKHYTIVDAQAVEDLGSSRPPPAPAVPVFSPRDSIQEESNRVQTPRETAEFFADILNSQFSGARAPISTSSAAAICPTVSNLNVTTGIIAPSEVVSTPTRGYLGHSVYLGHELNDHEESAAQDNTDIPHRSLTEDDWKVLHLRRAFDLPPRAVCESLVATFIAKCHPWMPVVEDEILSRLQYGNMNDTPVLLLQAIFMAGSRMQRSASALDHASVQDYYNRAKVLFFANYEHDPMTLIKAVTILQYWNPSGPEHVSIHNSSYWMRIGVGLAFQIGLHRAPVKLPHDNHIRRRIFWSLFARGSLLSAGQGRPRAIHIEDCTINWPSAEDFPANDKISYLFPAYVRISGILGDLTRWYLRGCNDASTRIPEFEAALRNWIRELPGCLRMKGSDGRNLPYDPEARQLYLVYFTAISILYRPHLPSRSTRHSQATIGSTIASSCVARLLEDSLARGDVRDGVAMHAIYALIAGIGALSNYNYPLLWAASQAELKIITLFLAELAKTWQTAKGTLRILHRLQESVSMFKNVPDPPPLVIGDFDTSLLEPFSTDLSRKWPIIIAESAVNPKYRDITAMTRGRAEKVGSCGLNGGTDSELWLGDDTAPIGQVDLSPPSIMSNMFEGISRDSLYSYGNWFLEDSLL
ncbi:hypothetical protein BKA65DRAFT_510761 [Rhexocercosporidium sp. MPI-PUGE-AT-0058]|nr:hypothetical protein BKA65DRAFT_510761 [Rhexocercosporidium sp. MPI-PUGE-AT-0058]